MGYVYAPLLLPVALHLEALKRGEIKYTVKKINIRLHPSRDAEVVGELLPETKIKAGLLKDEWYAVFDLNETKLKEENAFGYVYAPFLKPIAAPFSKTREEAPLKYGDECLYDCSLTKENKNFLLGDPTVAAIGEYATGISFDLGWTFSTYDRTRSIGNTVGNLSGLSYFLSYDNWTLGLSYRKDKTKVDFVRIVNVDQNNQSISEQDVNEIDISIRYIFRNLSFEHLTPYFVGGMTFVDIKEKRFEERVIGLKPGFPYKEVKKDFMETFRSSYIITKIGAGAIFPVNNILGLRGDIRGLMLSSNEAEDDTENTMTDSALGISALISGYWKIYNGWNMEAGFYYNYIKEEDGFKDPHYKHIGSEVGCLKKTEYFIKLGYSYKF